ncbi:MAG: hypothetical protein IPH37_18890 [Burkholderiales bacterium]|nr:hypothetical protein [Burkholderiales bacterium]
MKLKLPLLLRDMDLESFHQELMSSVRVAAEANRDFVRSAFVEEAGSRLSDAEEITDFQICHYEGLGARKRRLQVDGLLDGRGRWFDVPHRCGIFKR